MAIERIKIRSASAWHRNRARDVTASVVGALLGCHEFTTRYALWAEKSGIAKTENIDDSPAVRRGRLLEDDAVQVLQEERPHWQITHNTGAGTVYFRDPDARLGATPDVIAIDPARGPGIVQIKSVEPFVYRKKWVQEDGTIEPPLWIALQATLEGYLTGSNWAAVAPFIVGHGVELPIIEVPIIPGVIDRLRAESLAFWQMVERGEEPTPDYGLDASVIERMYARDEGEEVDLSSDNRILDLIADRHRLKEAAKATSAEIEAIDAEIKHKMRGATIGHLPGGRKITWRLQRRAGFYSEPSVCRVLRVPQPE